MGQCVYMCVRRVGKGRKKVTSVVGSEILTSDFTSFAAFLSFAGRTSANRYTYANTPQTNVVDFTARHTTHSSAIEMN